MAQHSKQSGWSPLFWLATGVAGGILLSRYWSNTPAAAPATKANNSYDSLRMPSSRLGAREEQVTPLSAPREQSPLPGNSDKDDPGTTAAAFDLDPQSVNPG
jgi:hypothetical protein